jgi:hypothetical protein
MNDPGDENFGSNSAGRASGGAGMSDWKWTVPASNVLEFPESPGLPWHWITVEKGSGGEYNYYLAIMHSSANTTLHRLEPGERLFVQDGKSICLEVTE